MSKEKSRVGSYQRVSRGDPNPNSTHIRAGQALTDPFKRKRKPEPLTDIYKLRDMLKHTRLPWELSALPAKIESDGLLIVTAVNALPGLLDERKRLREEIAALKKGPGG